MAGMVSILAIASFYRFEELRCVEAEAVFEDEDYVFYVVDPGAGVALDDDEVSVLAYCDGADLLVAAEVLRAVEGCDLDGFDGREAGLDEEFDLALVAEAGEDVAVAGGVWAGEEGAAGGDEAAFELLLAGEKRVSR